MFSCFRERLASRLFLVSLPAILLQGCATGTYYTILDPYSRLSDKDKEENPLSFGMQPFSLDAPLLKEKGDKMLQFGATTGMIIHGGYAITNHIGIYAGANLAGRNEKIDQSSQMLVLREDWNQGYLIDSDTMWAMGTLSGKAKLTQGHIEAGLLLFKSGKKGLHNELIMGAGATNALTRHELNFEYVDAVNPLELRESRINYQVFTQYNMGYRNTSAEVVWMNRFGRVWQYQREFDPEIRELNYDVISPYGFYSTGIRIGAGKAHWHIYAQFERVFPLQSTLMRWKKNQVSVGVVIRPFSQNSSAKDVQ